MQSSGKRKRSDNDDHPAKLRRIIESHRDMATRQANADKRSYLGALKYLPHAIYKLLENMPNPWESKKEVNVIYHTSGAVTFINDIPLVDPMVYSANWGQMWTQMQEEKKARTNFRRMRLPLFDDEEQMQSWKDITEYYPNYPDPIPCVPLNQPFECLQQTRPFFVHEKTPAIFDLTSFEISKQLRIQLPNGPRFMSQESELPDRIPTAFDDPQRIIVRPRAWPVRVETRIAFPYLYGDCNLIDFDSSLPQFDFPANCLVTRHDDKIAFFTDSTITPAPKTRQSHVSGFLDDFKLDDEVVAQSLALYRAEFPFNEADAKKRAQDITLIKHQYTKRRPLRVMATKTRQSYQRLLKRTVKQRLHSRKSHHAPSGSGNPPNLLKLLGQTKFFQETKIDWLEAGMQLFQQGHTILQLLIHKRGLHFMHLDYNFNLKPTKTLTTKERKRSRFGNSFHLVRELLKLVKLVVDCHIQYRMGSVDSYELADSLNYIFTHMGQLTGIYRYKYKVMHQITACNDLKHVVYDRFNMDGVGKGPGCGIWQPCWRIWLGFLRGMLPMLERWLGNLIQRQFFGRVSKGITKTVTKQRIDSHYDLELRASVLHDILDTMPENLRKSKTKVIMEHLSEAWRCWKANIPWEVDGMPGPIAHIINRYIQVRADHWIKVAKTNRERIRAGKVADKAVARKNMGRLTRLWMRTEQTRQEEYASSGPYLDPEDAVLMYKTMAEFLRESSGFGVHKKISFPNSDNTKPLLLALEGLRDGYNMTARLSNTQREELLLLEQAYDNPHDALLKIKRTILSQRVFKNVEVALLDFHSHLSPVYQVEMSEKIVDAFLDQYLWNEADRMGLFPSWLKPSDDEVTPIMVRKFCSDLNNVPELWNTENDETSAIVHLKLHKFAENADLTLLNQLLKLIVDPEIADYITAKMNASLSFKDMLHVNQYGIIRGFQFSSFVVQYYLMMTDVLLLGLPRALDFFNQIPNLEHPIKHYMRYLDNVYCVFHFDRVDADDMEGSADLLPFTKHCWTHDQMMRMIRRDVQLGNALIAEMSSRVPQVLGDIECTDASVYSTDNPALLFELAGFEVRLVPRNRMQGEEYMWQFANSKTMERDCAAAIKVSKDSIDRFSNRVRQILMSSGSTTFAKIVKRWNTTLTALGTYFREAAIATPELLDVIVKCEIRVQNKVKMGLNSKMPARFPPCVFYSPEELGGLGMLSASHVMIPESDIYGKIKNFKHGMDSLIPNLFRYITSWETEFNDSKRVWIEYSNKKLEAQATNTRISLEDLEHIWNRGLPRINTMFQRDRGVLAYEKGFRVRQYFRTFSNEKYDPFWWTNSRHDGRLWNFSNYRTDVIQALGGIKSILEHTLFKGTGFDDWEGLFWQKQSGFEQQMQMQKLTNAQRSGLSQIPNRRFTLWWSPTINRANVYIGFLVQLDLTGIFLHGKIPTLKISYIQIFRAHLWQKIHESLVLDLCQILDKEQPLLQIEGIEKLPIHPRKSYRMQASTADILLKSIGGGYGGWPISKPSLLNDDNDQFDFASSSDFWIDIQLRYGDFDSHDITRYTRAKFLDYTTDGISKYPSKTGLVICVDLAYNSICAYGHWFPGLKKLMRVALAKIIQANPALFILRERIRKALQLHQSQPRQPHLTASNYLDVMTGNNLIVDDSQVYRVTMHKTKNGNMASKPINGALFFFNPTTGKLFLQVIHAATAWAGQKRLSSVSKWKAAEETANLLRTFQEMPEYIIISTRGLRDPMDVNMLEFSNVKVRNSELSMPFGALLLISQFQNLVDEASQPQVYEFDMYDNWLDISQPSTAFSRLMLVLRGYMMNAEQTSYLLDRRNSSEKSEMWPLLTRDEWVDVENDISDMIVEEYGKQNQVNPQTLTQTEIRDIILGQPITKPEDRIQEVANQSNESKDPTSLTTTTHNVHGDEITVVTTSQYEKQAFQSRSTWRNKALEASSTLQYKSQSIAASNLDGSHTVTVPRNLVEQFVSVCDTQNTVIGLLYGNGSTVESIALVPQLGTATNVMFSQLPDIKDQFIGYIRSQPNPRGDKYIPPADLTLIGQRELNCQVILLANFLEGEIEVQAFQPTAEGIDWGSNNRDLLSSEPYGYDPSFGKPCNVKLEMNEGFFYVPDDDLWNFSFMSVIFNSQIEPFMKPGMPLQYYDAQHRPIHFTMHNLENDLSI